MLAESFFTIDGKSKNENGEIVYPDADGNEQVLDPATPVSMNFWGFTPWIFGKIQEYFCAFLKNLPDDDLKSECLLPIFVDSLIHGDVLDVSVLYSDDKWFGMTYQEDKSIVIAALRALHDAGEYPETLR